MTEQSETERDEATERRVADARSRMTRLATRLCNILAPIDAAGVLMGAAIGVLQTSHGAEVSASYLRELADEMLNDQQARTIN